MFNKLMIQIKNFCSKLLNFLRPIHFAFIVIFIFSSIWLCSKLLIEISYNQKLLKQKMTANSLLKSNVEAIEKIKQNYALLKKSGPEPSNVLLALPTDTNFAGLGNEYEAMASFAGARLSKVEQIGEPEKFYNQKTESDGSEVMLYRYKIRAKGNYSSLQNLTKSIEIQMRPTKIESLRISGLEPELTIEYTLVTYFKPISTATPKIERVQ